MRAARLLQILLLLQNRGRLTSAQLAREVEVSTRTILRDVDAMTEAGLPIIVHQGNQGGIELGFNYRSRLTGLARDEAEALGLILAAENPVVAALGAGSAAERARSKLIESLPDRTRQIVQETQARFAVEAVPPPEDPRVPALAQAIKAACAVRLRFASPDQQEVHPVALRFDGAAWWLRDALSDGWIGSGEWGRLNVSSVPFGPVAE